MSASARLASTALATCVHPRRRGPWPPARAEGTGHRLEWQWGPDSPHPVLGLSLPHTQGLVSAAVPPGLSRPPDSSRPIGSEVSSDMSDTE